MAKSIGIALLLTLAGCAGTPRSVAATDGPCATHEASYACQVERYHHISVP
ncbi:MAG TPA: hypothetical protein VIL30_04220 [Ramlibacter sp.]|jgi:hypothetical protein